MKGWLLAIFLGVIAIAPVFLVAYYYRSVRVQEGKVPSIEFQPERFDKKLEEGAEIEVRACKVLDGYRFQMYLEGGNWIEAHLPVATKQEAAQFVIDLLSKATPPAPTVKLKRKLNGCWIVDFHLTVDGKRSNLVDVLKAKGLLL